LLKLAVLWWGEMMNHVVLLGDSIFDNAAYVGGGPAVITQVQQRLPPGWRSTLLAEDGAVTSSILRQLERLPVDTTHTVISIGGNDALGQTSFLGDSAKSVAEVLQRLATIGDTFERNYLRVVEAVQRRSPATALCTIYYPAYPDPLSQRLAVTGLTVFNDVIIRAAFSAALPLLDLRLICNEATDYTNPIEPSVAGGAKIASAITHLITRHDFSQCRTSVFIQ
jgi:lysophospholipase L1-like esterase